MRTDVNSIRTALESAQIIGSGSSDTTQVPQMAEPGGNSKLSGSRGLSSISPTGGASPSITPTASSGLLSALTGSTASSGLLPAGTQSSLETLYTSCDSTRIGRCTVRPGAQEASVMQMHNKLLQDGYVFAGFHATTAAGVESIVNFGVDPSKSEAHTDPSWNGSFYLSELADLAHFAEGQAFDRSDDAIIEDRGVHRPGGIVRIYIPQEDADKFQHFKSYEDVSAPQKQDYVWKFPDESSPDKNEIALGPEIGKRARALPSGVGIETNGNNAKISGDIPRWEIEISKPLAENTSNKRSVLDAPYKTPQAHTDGRITVRPGASESFVTHEHNKLLDRGYVFAGFHATSNTSAENIIDNGIDPSKSKPHTDAEWDRGFYIYDESDLAHFVQGHAYDRSDLALEEDKGKINRPGSVIRIYLPQEAADKLREFESYDDVSLPKDSSYLWRFPDDSTPERNEIAVGPEISQQALAIPSGTSVETDGNKASISGGVPAWESAISTPLKPKVQG